MAGCQGQNSMDEMLTMIGKLEIHMRKMFSVTEKINLEMENLSLRLKILNLRMDNIDLQTKEKAKLEKEITGQILVECADFLYNGTRDMFPEIAVNKGVESLKTHLDDIKHLLTHRPYLVSEQAGAELCQAQRG